jgi:hypothetical protein
VTLVSWLEVWPTCILVSSMPRREATRFARVGWELPVSSLILFVAIVTTCYDIEQINVSSSSQSVD